MKNYFCSDNPLVRGCAVLEKFETNNPDQTEINEDACDDWCALGNTGNELSFFEGIVGYGEDGSPQYENGGARDCSGQCSDIDDNGNLIQQAWLDDCGWCCSCNTQDGEECIPPYTLEVVDDEHVPNFNTN